MDGNTLEVKGYSIEILPIPPRSTALYKHKDGRIVRLPDDPYSRRHYLASGLVLYNGKDPALSKPLKKRARRKSNKEKINA